MLLECIILGIIMHCNVNLKKLCRNLGKEIKKKIEGGGEENKKIGILCTPVFKFLRLTLFQVKRGRSNGPGPPPTTVFILLNAVTK